MPHVSPVWLIGKDAIETDQKDQGEIAANDFGDHHRRISTSPPMPVATVLYAMSGERPRYAVSAFRKGRLFL